MKKGLSSKFKLLFYIIVAIVFVVGAISLSLDNAKEKKEIAKAEEQTQTEVKAEPTAEPTPEEPAEPTLTDKFVALGFTEDESKQMEEIFINIGAMDIGEIKSGFGTGIDELQAFVAPVSKNNQLQINFTVENRELCYVALAGVETYKPEMYISFFGNLKVRERRTITSVDLFDRWVDDTDYHQPIEDSYLAKFDCENMEIVELKENGVK